MHHVARREDARHAGLHVFIHHGAVVAPVHLHARAARKLVFRNEPHAQKQRVAVEMHLRAGDGSAVFIHLLHGHARQAALPLDLRHRVGQIQRDIIIVQALHDVARQTAGIRHHLNAGQHLRALQRHAAGHDKADIARAQNHHAAAHHVALNVQIPLGRARGEYASRARARDGNGAARAFAAAHAQHDGRGLQHNVAVLFIDGVDAFFRRDGQHHRVRLYLYVRLAHQLDEAARVLGARELFFKIMQAEAVVDALVEDAAQRVVALQEQDAARAALVRGLGRRQPGGACADDDDVVPVILHDAGPLPSWCR